MRDALMHKSWILPVGNKKRLGSTCCVLSANCWIAINVINGCWLCIFVYMPVFQRLAIQPMKPLHNAYSKKRLPTLPFLAECFCILRSLSDFMFVNEVCSFCSDRPLMVFAGQWDGRSRDVHKTLSRKTETVNPQDRDETETFHFFKVSRPRRDRDVQPSRPRRDRDVPFLKLSRPWRDVSFPRPRRIRNNQIFKLSKRTHWGVPLRRYG